MLKKLWREQWLTDGAGLKTEAVSDVLREMAATVAAVFGAPLATLAALVMVMR